MDSTERIERLEQCVDKLREAVEMSEDHIGVLYKQTTRLAETVQAIAGPKRVDYASSAEIRACVEGEDIARQDRSWAGLAN